MSRLSHRLLFAGTLFACASCNAGQLDAHAALEDAKLFVTAPLRWDARDWTYFGATALAVAAAHEYDDDVRTHFARNSATTDDRDPHSTRDWGPAAAMVGLTWAYAALIDDKAGYAEGSTMIEAAAFSAVTTEALKFAAGRLRPYETSSPDGWRDSGNSFPSSHASITFAIGTVLAESGNEKYRWLRRTLGYGAASAVSYARVHDGAHWLSDTVAGAALGIATAQFAMHRRNASDTNGTLSFAPLPEGAALSYTVRFK
jgi:hypothetical protein